MKHLKKFESNEHLEKTIVWFSIENCGDGSAYPKWFLTEDESEYDQENMDMGWGECCNGSVETYVGSDIHKQAVINSKEQSKTKKK